MNVLKRFYLFFLYHSRKYNRILQLTPIRFGDKLKNIDSVALKYQARCSFFKSDFYHAKSVLEMLEEKKELSPVESNMLAFIYARRNEKEKAISSWCKTLELKKKEKLAFNALEYIKSQGRAVDLAGDDYFNGVRPKQPFILPLKMFSLVLLGAALLTGGYFATVYVVNWFEKNRRVHNSDLDKIRLPDYNTNLLSSPKVDDEAFSFNEKEIKSYFYKIKKHIGNKDFVEARILTNILLLSNASEGVKMEVGVLETWIDEPDYGVFKNKYTYQEVSNNRLIYNNIYIKWRGRIVNHEEYNDKVTFELVIGNDAEGEQIVIIPVYFDKKAVVVRNNEIIDLVGFVNVIDGKIVIDGRHVIRVTG